MGIVVQIELQTLKIQFSLPDHTNNLNLIIFRISVFFLLTGYFIALHVFLTKLLTVYPTTGRYIRVNNGVLRMFILIIIITNIPFKGITMFRSCLT